jgi:ribosomal protein S21
MLKVKGRAGESVQQMIRRFKKLCEKEGLIRDMKRISYYEKPSEKEPPPAAQGPAQQQPGPLTSHTLERCIPRAGGLPSSARCPRGTGASQRRFFSRVFRFLRLE